MHYSVPVFIQPTTQADTAAKLQWKLQQRDGKHFLEVSNQGNAHAHYPPPHLYNEMARKVISPDC